MLLFDVHCHLQDERLLTQLPAVLNRAAAAGVAAVNCCGCTANDWPVVAGLTAQAAAVKHVKNVKIIPSFGLHPCHTTGRSPDWLRQLECVLTAQPSGIGEIGLDRLIPGHDDAGQEKIFIQELELAQRLRRPVTIHCRRAWGRLLEILKCEGAPPAGFLMHAWGGSVEVMAELLDLGAYISFAGNISYEHHRRARRALQAVPAERLLLETDSPDLLPAGARSACNEPANLALTLAAAAQLRRVPPDELAAQTFQNSCRLFGVQYS